MLEYYHADRLNYAVCVEKRGQIFRIDISADVKKNGNQSLNSELEIMVQGSGFKVQG